MLDTGNAKPGSRIEIIPFEAWHLRAINEQDAESYWGEMTRKPEYADQLEKGGPAHTAMRDGIVLCCSGIIPQWEDHAKAWAIMARQVGGDYITIHRAVKRFLKLADYKRVDTTVDCEFPAGIRWAEMLGFKRETPEPMLNYAPGGRSHYLYARIA